MINHANYELYRQYLRYLTDLGQLDPKSIQVKASRLKWVLKWADEAPIERSPTLRPTLPKYLAAVKAHPGRAPTHGHLNYVLVDARLFFRWLIQLNPKRFPTITELWINTLYPLAATAQTRPTHEAVTLDMVRRIIALPADGDLVTWRDQAAAAFLFLSGCRASAFASLTLDCIDISARTVNQDPTRGVRTKFRKSAVTHLLEIPDLLEFVTRWDTHIRAVLPASACWYTVINPVTLAPTADPPGQHRPKILARGLARLFTAVGLPPMTTHKFRHGHAVYGLTHAKDMADLKAVSQNLMHANIGITDGIYAILSEQDRRDRIRALGDTPPSAPTTDDTDIDSVIAQLETLLDKLKRKP